MIIIDPSRDPAGSQTSTLSWARRLSRCCRLIALVLTSSASSAQVAHEGSRLIEFRMPHSVHYRIETADPAYAASEAGARWLRAIQEGTTNQVQFGSRIAIQTAPGINPETLVNASILKVARALGADWYVLQAPDARTAAEEAGRLAKRLEIQVSYPVVRRALRLHGPYAQRPNDTYFDRQWNLEHRSADGSRLGVDLNARAAWSLTRGEGVVLAVVDDGIDLAHPEFAASASNELHFNFATGIPDGLPISGSDNHGTAVAGLAAAEWNNNRGMAGVAPEVQLASWKIFLGFALAASDEQLMDMFQHRADVIGVQNHSWGNSGTGQLAPTPLEDLGVSNAIALGRQGRGIIMVRSGGNGRGQLSDANDDAYASDPRVVTVAAVRRDGRAADYSSPGACLLVATPGGAADANLFTTDRRGSAGFNAGTYPDDFADYVFSSVVQGTSFSAPQISGLAALLLSANPALTYRDVQLILALSSRHFDEADSDLAFNGAGLRVSHNAGFGIPDAGYAVVLARRWLNRSPLTELRLSASPMASIPDDGLRVTVTGEIPVPAEIASIPGTPSLGVHADTRTAALPLVDIGLASSPVITNLEGKGALIQRGTHLFIEKIEAAARAGAAFAIIYNNVGTTDRVIMGATDFAPIPALLVGRDAGETLLAQLDQDPALRARIELAPAHHTFMNMTTNTLICEHVGLRVRTTHPRRGDLRITLTSPAGTRSVLQRINNDASSGPFDWTYYSVHHFLEPSRGPWQVEISDEQPSNAGTVTELELVLRGVAITDSDGDALDDHWEIAQFGNLDQGPRDDPDADGYSNALEQVLGANALAQDRPFLVDLSIWNETHARLSWPGFPSTSYEVLGIPEPNASPDLFFAVPGQFPVTERFIPLTHAQGRFFRVRALEQFALTLDPAVSRKTHLSPRTLP